MHELGSIYSLTQAQKILFSVMVRVANCCPNDLGSITGHVSKFFENYILLNSSNQTRFKKKNSIEHLTEMSELRNW